MLMYNERGVSREFPACPDEERAVFEYFYAGSPEHDARAEYLAAHDLVETNNLGLWLLNPHDEATFYPWDYTRKAYGHVFEESMEEYPELFLAATTIKHLEMAKSAEYWDAQQRDLGSSATLAAELAELNHRSERLMTDVFRVIAPRMTDAGYDMIDTCK